MEENSNKETIEKGETKKVEQEKNQSKVTENKESEKNKTENEKVEKKETSKKEAKKENSESEEDTGIEISNDVIAVIAGVAVSEVEGVASMAGGLAGGISEVFSGKKNMAKGIKVDKTETTAKIDVNIIVEYGSRIPDVAYEVQKRVKKSVESMTGLTVEEVNVHIQGVDTNFAKNKKKQKSEEEKEKQDETKSE